MSADNVRNYLAAAKSAVAAVKAALPLGAGNRADDREVTYRRTKQIAGKNYPCDPVTMEIGARLVSLVPEALVVAMRVEDALGLLPQGKNKVDRIRILSNQAKRYRTGNCSDQACVAFIALYDAGVRPLDIMFLTNLKHCFVVIGREDGSGEDPATWGNDAVICDPWNNDAYQLLPATANGMLLAKMQCNCSKAKSQLRV